MNERYQKNTAPAGKTRKSAAAAKPKRPTGAGGSSASKKSSSAGKRASGQRIPLHPPTAEYRLWRRIWLGLMVAAMAIIALSWWLMQEKSPYGLYALIAAYVVLGVGLFIDFVKLRRLRLDWQASGGTLPDARSEKPGKVEDSTTNDADAQADDSSSAKH